MDEWKKLAWYAYILEAGHGYIPYDGKWLRFIPVEECNRQSKEFCEQMEFAIDFHKAHEYTRDIPMEVT